MNFPLFDSEQARVNGATKAEISRRAVKVEIDGEVPASIFRKHSRSSLSLDPEAGALS